MFNNCSSQFNVSLLCVHFMAIKWKHSSLSLLYFCSTLLCPCVLCNRTSWGTEMNLVSSSFHGGQNGPLSSHLLSHMQFSELEVWLPIMISLLWCMQFKWSTLQFLLLVGFLRYHGIWRQKLFVCIHFAELFRFQFFFSFHVTVLIGFPTQRKQLNSHLRASVFWVFKKKYGTHNKTQYSQDDSGCEYTLEQSRYSFYNPGLLTRDIWFNSGSEGCLGTTQLNSRPD